MTRGVASIAIGTETVADVLARGDRSFSFEFFPPKDAAGEEVLWRAIRRLEGHRPTFVSVTYGAGGSNRGAVVEVTKRIAEQTTLRPMAHLTCVGHSRAELRSVIGCYADAGVRHVLALRGDPPGGPDAEWIRHPDGFDHAVELVEYVRSLGHFTVGVAAFPDKHPQARSLQHDAEMLVAKERAGADFAVTQLFFDASAYRALVDRVTASGGRVPIIPGIMPITNVAQIKRMALLSGAPIPARVLAALEPYADDPAAVRRIGVELASDLCRDLLDSGAPGLHFYTLNRSQATTAIYANVVGAPGRLPTRSTLPSSAAASAAESAAPATPVGR